ncbi:MAG TPA: hypothetical protein VLR50_03205 [Desulfobacterales bacterium]|nr:hypothetical protein [Desulfobacterales bacterium]
MDTDWFFFEAISINERVLAFVKATRSRKLFGPESDRSDGARPPKRVLAFARHITYGLPTMKQQLRCPHYFLQQTENVTQL